MSWALICEGLEKRLGGKPVLQTLNLNVAQGEVVSLLGASGSGKTTLLRAIAGLNHPDAGRITLNGTEIFAPGRLIPAEKRQIGMVFQDYALWPHMTVAGNLGFALASQRLAPAEAQARITHALDVTRLGPLRDRLPAALSGGQQQRVAIARCLAARPQLMLFDEPLSNLDAALREDLRTEMMDLVRQEGITVIYVTHDQAEAMAVSDRIAVMREGEIAQLDTPETLYNAPATPFVASFIGGFSLLPGQAQGGMFLVDGQTLTLPGTTGPVVLVIRPEDACPATLHPATRLIAKVLHAAYQGRCWRLTVEIAGQILRLDWPNTARPGDQLEFSLPPDRCLLLPIPIPA
ncbi:MAG: ABC transporter ATP-binding protein [Alphaproteobacteria bacterium]|jgi:ABC-type Fe3+/spermidine/putrescine transport system ATPase subunit